MVERLFRDQDKSAVETQAKEYIEKKILLGFSLNKVSLSMDHGEHVCTVKMQAAR